MITTLGNVHLVKYTLLFLTTSAELCQVVHSTSSATLNLLHQIEGSLDQTVNPCEDFYGYACNNFWPLYNNTMFDEAEHQMDLKLINVMDSLYQLSLPDSNLNQSIFDKAYIYYKSCVNVRDTTLLSYFEVIKPGKDLEWPLMEELQAHRRGDTDFVVKEWPVGQFDVFALLGQLQSYGLNHVLIYQMLSDADSVLKIGRPEIESKYYFFHTDLTDILMEWGLPEEIADNYGDAIMDTHNYWYKLFQNYSLPSQHDVIPYRILKQQFPYLSDFLESIYPDKFRNVDRIEVYDMKYFGFLMTKQWSAKEAQELSTYLMLRFVDHLQKDKATGFSKPECIHDLRQRLDLPTNLLYYEYVYKPEELFYNPEIYAFFNKTLHYTMDILLADDWNLTTTGRDEVRANISSMVLNIGNLPRNLRMSLIEKFFRNIPDLELYNYHKNHLQLLRHRVLKSLLPLKKQSYSILKDKPGDWSLDLFYDIEIHMLIVPFSVIQPPIYQHSYDPLFKWALLGQELAYIMVTNIVDNILKLKGGGGQQLDDCLQPLGTGEVAIAKFAYLVSSHVAYKAYTHEQRNNQLQPPFTNISWKKLFFLNIYQKTCVPAFVNVRELVPLMQIVMHSERFTEAFQCPVDDSKMNTTKQKCHNRYE